MELVPGAGQCTFPAGGGVAPQADQEVPHSHPHSPEKWTAWIKTFITVKSWILGTKVARSRKSVSYPDFFCLFGNFMPVFFNIFYQNIQTFQTACKSHKTNFGLAVQL